MNQLGNEDLWSTLTIATWAVGQTSLSNLPVALLNHFVAARDGLGPVVSVLLVVGLVPFLLECAAHWLPVLNEVEVNEEVVWLFANHHWLVELLNHVVVGGLVLEL